MYDDLDECINLCSWQMAVTKNTFIHAASGSDDAFQGSRASRSSSEPASTDEARARKHRLTSKRQDHPNDLTPAFIKPAKRLPVSLTRKAELSVDGGGRHLSRDSCKAAAGSKQSSSSVAWRLGKPRTPRQTSSLQDTPQMARVLPASLVDQVPTLHASSGLGQDADAKSKEKVCSRASCADTALCNEQLTTVMIRQLARSYTQWMLKEEANNRGFKGLYDFVYVPFDSKKGRNVGYGFMNFMDPQSAKAFRDAFDGSLESSMVQNGKPLRVHPAKVQGYEANFSHFLLGEGSLNHDHQNTPLFLRRESQPGSRQQSKTCPDMARGQWATIHILEQDMAAQICHTCGIQSCGKQKFCATCGTRFKLTCNSCGTSHGPKDKFCVNCGLRLDNIAEVKS